MKRRDLKQSGFTIVLLFTVSISTVASVSAPRDLEQVLEKLQHGSRVRLYLQKQSRIARRLFAMVIFGAFALALVGILAEQTISA